MDPKKVNILGTEYEVAFVPEWEDSKLSTCGGYIDPTIHKIVVSSHFPENNDNVDDLSAYSNDVLRHELIHAFFRESGL